MAHDLVLDICSCDEFYQVDVTFDKFINVHSKHKLFIEDGYYIQYISIN